MDIRDVINILEHESRHPVNPEAAREAYRIAAERMRQINEEGWTPEHDDEHDNGEPMNTTPEPQTALAERVADDVSIGCTDVSNSLGVQKMPNGYALMLDADRMFFYGLKHDGTETDIHCDKWAIYRWAKADAALPANARFSRDVRSTASAASTSSAAAEKEG